MLEGFNPNRYAIIDDKNKREIVMLVGTGCKWKQCAFCDYHLDFDPSEEVCFTVNQSVLNKVSGIYKKLEVINSGSFTELDSNTMDLIESIAVEKSIKEINFECHYLYRNKIPILRERFKKHGINVKMKCGVETFDTPYRENFLKKGMKNASIEELKKYFDQVCLLFGLDGQTLESMKTDIAIGLSNFERICINIMHNNTSGIKQNPNTVNLFKNEILPKICSDQRIDILMENTDFGVGGMAI